MFMSWPYLYGQLVFARPGKQFPVDDVDGLRLPVSESLSWNLLQNVHLVVVSESAREFLVGHSRLALLLPPQFGQLVRIDDLKDEALLVIPDDALRPITVQQLRQKLPKKSIFFPKKLKKKANM